MATQEIFKRIEAEKDQNIMREVSISMMEIYNEKVHDLLAPVSRRKDVVSFK